MQTESIASDNRGGRGKGKAKATEANVGRLAREIAGGARFIHLDGALLLNPESPATLGGVIFARRWTSMQKSHHIGVIGTIDN